jgi:DNA-binding transcriptional ArsR family regulator
VTNPSDELFRLLADPTRRRILDLLAERGSQTVGQLASEFPDLVASGISKHLMGLRAAGLVHATRDGRHQRYRIDDGALSEALVPWLARYERYWSDALVRLRALAEGGEPGRPPQPAGSPKRGARASSRPVPFAVRRVGPS